MKRIHPGGCLLLVVLLLGSAGPAFGLSYFGYNDFGGSWYDAEKTLGNTEDDLMCWAATGSNMLTYTGWGFPVGASFSNEDDIFAYFQNHWTDAGTGPMPAAICFSARTGGLMVLTIPRDGQAGPRWMSPAADITLIIIFSITTPGLPTIRPRFP
jgi:hypothetical protein